MILDSKGWMVAGLVAGLGAGIGVSTVLATGAPTVAPLVYAGTVTDKDGKAYPSEVDVQVAFYDAAMAGNLKCLSAPAKAAAASGRFETILPADCVAAVRETADLWSELTVGSGATKTVLPRTHVGAVPYALEADTASNPGGPLKQTLDSVKADIAALKAVAAAPGPAKMVDGAGNKIGTVVATMVLANATPTTLVRLLSPSGYYFDASFSGTSLQAQQNGLVFAQANCVGDAYMAGEVFPTKQAWYSQQHKAFYAPDVASNSPVYIPPASKLNFLSSYTTYTGCSTSSTGPFAATGVKVKFLTPTELGLPGDTSYFKTAFLVP